MPASGQQAHISKGWRQMYELGTWQTRHEAIDAVQVYADEHNLIRCYVIPQLHRASVKEWERRNGTKAPEFLIDK